jgi:hypothetical protein
MTLISGNRQKAICRESNLTEDFSYCGFSQIIRPLAYEGLLAPWTHSGFARQSQPADGAGDAYRHGHARPLYVVNLLFHPCIGILLRRL